MDRADRTTWMCYVMAAAAAVTIASPSEWPKTAIRLGIAAALPAVVGKLSRGAYTAKARELFATQSFRVRVQVPPSENENESIKYCQ
jgi:hypothetical protein